MKLGIVSLLVLVLGLGAVAQAPPRAVVLEFTNASKSRYTFVYKPAADALAKELERLKAYEIVTEQEIEACARNNNIRPPFSERNYRQFAKELGIEYLVFGEIQQGGFAIVDGKKGIEASILVKVKDIALDEVVSGGGERGFAVDPQDGRTTEGLVFQTALENASNRMAARINGNRPVVGTVMNSQSEKNRIIVNRGSANGVKPKMEFAVYRRGNKIGRLKVVFVKPNLCELDVVDGSGIQPEDRAVLVFNDFRIPPRQ